MAFGVVVVAWTLTLLPDLYPFFGAQGVVRNTPISTTNGASSTIWPGDTALMIGWVGAVVVGHRDDRRLAQPARGCLVFVLVQSFVRRDPYVFNAGDAIIVLVALVLALSSCGAALSVDQRRRTGSFWSAQIRSPWPVRLLQVQLSLIYLVTVQAKLSGDSWLRGLRGLLRVAHRRHEGRFCPRRSGCPPTPFWSTR